MGRIVKLSGPPPPVNIQLPGGAKISSMASATQGMPNAMDPFQSVIEGVQPALGQVKPVFDIIGFVMALMDVQSYQYKVIGAGLSMILPGNPFSAMFPVPPLKDDNGDPVPMNPAAPGADPEPPFVPDFPGLIPGFLDAIVKLICYAIKLAGLVPQLSTVAAIKDSLLTAMGFMDAAMAQTNSLTDLFSSLPVGNTGVAGLDALADAAGDNAGAQLAAKLGPVGNLVPLMSIVSLLADAAKQPLPAPILTLATLMANTIENDPPGFGVIPFPDLSDVIGAQGEPDAQREAFLGMIEDMTVTGLPIEIPDFSDLSSIPVIMDDIKQKLDPILPAIELVQSIMDKLTKC